MRALALAHGLLGGAGQACPDERKLGRLPGPFSGPSTTDFAPINKNESGFLPLIERKKEEKKKQQQQQKPKGGLGEPEKEKIIIAP